VNELVSLYRHFANIPIPSNAAIEKVDDGFRVRVKYSFRDLDLMEKCSFNKYFNINSDFSNVRCQSDACESSSELSVAKSKSLNKTAIVRKNNKENQKLKSYIEIWNKNSKIKSLTSETLEKYHGQIYLNSEFGALEWSPNERSLLYVSEHKVPKSESYFKEQEGDCNGEKEVSKGTEYAFKEEWGETFEGIHHTCVCIMDTEEKYKVRTIEMENLSLAQAFWIDDDKIGFIAWKEEPQRLGLVYCINRQSYLYCCNIRDETLKPYLLYGGDADECVRSPRASPDRKSIIFLANSILGPHFKASRLMRYDLEKLKAEIIIDTNVKDDGFPLYLKELPKNCFTEDGNYIVFDSINQCLSTLCMLDLNARKLQKISHSFASASVLDIRHNILAILTSAPNKFPNVYAAKIETETTDFKFLRVDADSKDQIDGVDYKIEVFGSDDSAKMSLSAIIIGPSQKMKESTPAIILPHGGPHSSFTVSYLMWATIFSKLGFKFILVNYRGSIGIDEDYINILCGNVGDMDVKDVMTCITQLISKNEIDSKKLSLFGGSHGGFLVTHLIGQFPDFGFKSCIARNPVVDIAGMIEVTDIPDWCFTEACGLKDQFKFGNFGTADVLKICFERSPFHYIENVKTPTFLLLGKNDKRVPMSQGIKYLRALKARGVDVKCNVYDDNHGLEKVQTESDSVVNVACFILEYLNK
ncbi:acylamino-acid-releasing enzyme-like isoform X1, partial [Dinothrombium tinctorium]